MSEREFNEFISEAEKRLSYPRGLEEENKRLREENQRLKGE